ncbi:gas vesicle protein [Streptosporangium carneum]|uniref:Gas vesicle protein n=1 Tax=Streptosporangium carneum TaxID=47481 RepID=A0A9W6HVX6_9ACTN|nr:gas vesicle protein [Streptosporangium carneum]GLK07023.1 hypothetical protein GCM10017600_04280 [Streptosporangium carneum]
MTPDISRDVSRGAALADQGRIPPQRVALVDLLDRLLAGGVVVTGDIVLSIADIDLVRISLRVLIMSVRESIETDRETAEGETTTGRETAERQTMTERETSYDPVWT